MSIFIFLSENKGNDDLSEGALLLVSKSKKSSITPIEKPKTKNGSVYYPNLDNVCRRFKFVDHSEFLSLGRQVFGEF